MLEDKEKKAILKILPDVINYKVDYRQEDHIAVLVEYKNKERQWIKLFPDGKVEKILTSRSDR